MAKIKYPVTAAIRSLRTAKAAFTPHLYTYEAHGGTASAAQQLGVPEARVIKTLVMETDTRAALIVLMHGDREVSLKAMARLLGVKTVTPCSPETATRHTGYLVGGTSPFGTRTSLPIYMEQTIEECATVFINGGKRGFLVELTPAEAVRVLQPQMVSAATPH